MYHKYKHIYHKYKYDHANQSSYTNAKFHTEDSTGWQVMLFNYHKSKDLRQNHKYKDKQTNTIAIIHIDIYKYKIHEKKTVSQSAAQQGGD